MWFLLLLPFAVALWVWFSPLAFVPVPWPDDSAFYFVAKYLFHWPPKFVMIPQAPFEPTYRIFNFNTMPLYPILIGLGRYVGIDGTFALKFWPLMAWATTGALLAGVLRKKGAPYFVALTCVAAFALDPVLRWASVLIRPESLIGLFGMALVLGLTFGFPKKLRPRGLWDPAAALLALAAYSHFNAVHLVFPAAFGIVFTQPNLRKALLRLFRVGALTTLYFVPWLILAAWHHNLLVAQMTLQWHRLATGNSWLQSFSNAIGAFTQSMGSPEPFPSLLNLAIPALWILALLGIVFGLLMPLYRYGMDASSLEESASAPEIPLLPSAAWVFGAAWLWNSKPEVWFTYYLHESILCFGAIFTYRAWLGYQPGRKPLWANVPIAASAGLLLMLFPATIFGIVDVKQARDLGKSKSWNWNTYHDFVDCIDTALTKLDQELGHERGSRKPFRAWFPTFPDVTIELSRRHSDWEFSRTNDFWERNPLAIKHGNDVDAVVVTETINWAERDISGPASKYPGVQSTWMNWKGYYLYQLLEEPGWKPNRYICQRGRWQAFLFMPQVGSAGAEQSTTRPVEKRSKGRR